MEFYALSDAERDEIVRRHLLQAEADWFTNVLNAHKATNAVAAATDDEVRAQMEQAAHQYRAAATRCRGDIDALLAVQTDVAAFVAQADG